MGSYGASIWNPPDEVVTYPNVEDIGVNVSVKWINKPLIDCILDLMTLGDCDCFIDNANSVHLFKRNSKVNDDEAITDNDLLIELKDFGKDSVDVRNKITTYGQAGDFPVIYTSEDSSSQDTYGIREKIIQDTSIKSEVSAQDSSDAEKVSLANPETKGSSVSMGFHPNLVPGYLTYVISPSQDIHDRYRPVKWTTSVPDEQTEIFYSEDKGISNLFKDRIQQDMKQENINNPYKMKFSYNFTYDDYTNIDTVSSSGYTLTNGVIKKTSAESGIIVSNVKTTANPVTQVHLLVKGETLDGATYWVQTKTTNQFQQIQINTLTDITSPDTNLIFKIIISNADTRIDECALLFK